MSGAMAGENLDRWLEWLGDLATYRPSDFLMFSPRTYWRLFELHNAAWWPLPWLLPLAGMAALAWVGRGGATAQRAGAVALAAVAAFVGWAFVLERYAVVNWAATGLAALWAALCLCLLALAAGGQARVVASVHRRHLAAALALWALLGQPLLAPLAGRPLAQAEVFGLAPDPTVMVALAWLLSREAASAGPMRWVRRVAWTMALALATASAATLAVLSEWQAVIQAAAVAACLGAIARGGYGKGKAR